MCKAIMSKTLKKLMTVILRKRENVWEGGRVGRKRKGREVFGKNKTSL